MTSSLLFPCLSSPVFRRRLYRPRLFVIVLSAALAAFHLSLFFSLTLSLSIPCESIMFVTRVPAFFRDVFIYLCISFRVTVYYFRVFRLDSLIKLN